MEKIGLAQKQLEQLYSEIAREKQRVSEIRKWVITIWIVILSGIVIKGSQLNGLEKFVVIMAPVIAFWFLEGIQVYWIKIDSIRAGHLEKYITSTIGDIKFTEDMCYVLGGNSDLGVSKRETLMEVFFYSPMVYSFYILLFLLSVSILVITPGLSCPIQH